MIAHIIAGLIGNYMTTLFVVGLIVALIRVLAHRGPAAPSSSAARSSTPS